LIALPILIILLTRYCQQHRRLAISSKAIKISIISILSVAVLAAGYWTYLYFNSIGIHQLKLEPYYYIGRGFNEFSQIFLLSSALALSILGLLQQFFRFK
jgi:glucan phosphoethanolaminetransferase (alkaline phosphatase superfamily)